MRHGCDTVWRSPTGVGSGGAIVAGGRVGAGGARSSELVLFLGRYRQALNDKGWDKFNAVAGQSHNASQNEEYCSVQTSEFAPDVANTFILDYFPSIAGPSSIVKQRDKLKFLGIDDKRLSNVILLIKHMCSWLFINKFSEGKVEMK